MSEQFRFDRAATCANESLFDGSPANIAHAVLMACPEVETVLFEIVSVARFHLRTIPSLPHRDARLVEAVNEHKIAGVVWQHAR